MAKVPEMMPVKSSNLQSLGYGSGMFVRFHGGSMYRYPDVPKELYEQGLKAESVGKWFSTEIRGQYRHEKLDE